MSEFHPQVVDFLMQIALEAESETWFNQEDAERMLAFRSFDKTAEKAAFISTFSPAVALKLIQMILNYQMLEDATAFQKSVRL